MRVFTSLSICIVFCMAAQALCEEAIPTYIDLEVGHSADFTTKDGVDHTVTLISQSLDAVVVEVDGIQSIFEMKENECGSPETTLFGEISGVLVLPEVMSDIQQSTDCREIEVYRRWYKLKVGWETGDQTADDDIDDPGFARLALMDPTDTLPQGIFPIEMSDSCSFLSNVKHVNYFLSKTY